MIKKKTINRKKLPHWLLSEIVKKGLLPYLVDSTELETKPPLNKTEFVKKVDPKVATKTLIQPLENIKLNRLLNKVIAAKNINELDEIVDRALESGIRINMCNERNCSFAEAVVFKIYADKPEDKGNKQENIMKKLMLRGAKFEKNIIQRDKKTTEVYDKLQKEVKPQIDAQLKKLKAIGENAAIKGNVTNVAIDNKNFYIEYSKDSMVNVAAVVDGTRNLGLSKGDIKLASNIIKFYDKGVEVKTQEDGKRNYVDISDGSGFEVVFPTTLGELHLLIFHNIENYDQVQVKVEDSEMWNKLQEMGEIVGKDCLFGGMSVGEAVKNGSFSRSRISEIIKPIGESKSSETLSWVNRLQNKKPISVVRS